MASLKDLSERAKKFFAPVVNSLPPVQAYNAVKQIATPQYRQQIPQQLIQSKPAQYFNPTSNRGNNFWSSSMGTGAAKLQQNIMGAGQKLQQFPDTTIRYKAPQPFQTPIQKLTAPIKYEAQKFLTGLPGEIVRDLGRTYETIASPNAKDIYKESIARVKQNPFQLKTLEEPIVRDTLNLAGGPLDMGDVGRFAVGALPVAGVLGQLKKASVDAKALKPFLPEVRNVLKMLGNMDEIPNLNQQQAKAVEEIVAKIKGPNFVEMINKNSRNATEYYNSIRGLLNDVEYNVLNPQVNFGLSTKARGRVANSGVTDARLASGFKSVDEVPLAKYAKNMSLDEFKKKYGFYFEGDTSQNYFKGNVDEFYQAVNKQPLSVPSTKGVESGFAPKVQQSSSGNIYIKTGKNEVVSGLPKTIQNDLYEIVQGRPVNPDRMYKTSEFLQKKGFELVRNEDTFKYELKKVSPVTKGVESMSTVKVSTTTPKTIKVVRQSTKPQQVSLKDIDNGLTPKSTLEDKTIQQQGAASFDSSLPQRGFAKTVMESPKTPDVLKLSLEQQRYNPLSNKQTLSYADNLIKKSETEALNYARTGTDTNANATASRLIEKYLDAGRFDEADDLIRTVAPRFTKQGQDIQILATYGRLTPTGAVRYAQNLINKANKANPRLNLKLTPERTKIITQYAKDIRGLKDGSREKIVATAKLIQNIKDIVPTSIGQKISSIQTMMQLLNPKTAIRNTVGNVIFTGMENISDVLGSGIDNIVGIITGKRSKVLPSVKAQIGGLVRGAKEGLEDVKLGVDTSGGMATQFDFQGKTFTDPIFGNLEKALNIELRVPDRAAYTAAFEGSINNQMRAAGVKAPTEEMLQVAHADGLYRTFQDNSKLANFFSNIKKTLNILGTPDGRFGVGDFLLKYPRTPANILSRGLDYSPAGFVKGIYEVVRPLLTGQEFNQKAFVEALSRAMAGTGLITAGYVLADKGIITGKSEKDYDISSIKKTTGQGPFKLNIDALKRYWISGGQKQDAQNGDLLVSYDWAQPTSLQLAMGANSAMGGGNEGALDGVLNSLQGGVDTLTGQPMVKGLMDFATGVKNKGLVGAGSELAINSLSGFSPSIMRQFANLTDTTQRSTYDPSMVKEGINRLTSTIPFARKSLQPKIDVFGREMPNYEGGTAKRIFDIFFNPAFTSRVKENPAAKEVIDIYERSGLTTQAPRVAPETVTINEQKVKVSPRQYTEYQKYIGTKTDAIFNELVKSPSFTNLSDDEKAKTMQNILTDINSAAKIEIFGNNPKTISNRTKSIIGGNINVSDTSTKSTKTKFAKTPKIKKPKKITVKAPAVAKRKISNIKITIPKGVRVANPPSLKRYKPKNIRISIGKSRVQAIKFKPFKNTLTEGFTKLA